MKRHRGDRWARRMAPLLMAALMLGASCGKSDEDLRIEEVMEGSDSSIQTETAEAPEPADGTASGKEDGFF